MRKVVAALSVIVALTAAGLWFCSASIKLPVPTFDGLGPNGDFMRALALSARLNQWAALTTGVSVLLTLAGSAR